MWRTDGTVEGTKLVKDINPGPAGALFDGDGYYSPQFTAVGGTLYFIATDGVAGFELWKSDGTEAGTVMVKDTVPGGQGITSCGLSDEYDDADCLPSLIAVGDLLFFTGIDIAHGREIWKSDGPANGTALVDDLYPGPDSLYLIAWTSLEETLYFIHQGYDGGNALWRTDGTAGGTAVGPAPTSSWFLRTVGAMLARLGEALDRARRDALRDHRNQRGDRQGLLDDASPGALEARADPILICPSTSRY